MEFLLVLPVPGSSYRDLDEFMVLEERVSETDFLIVTKSPLAAYSALEKFSEFDARPELRAALLHNENDDYEVFQREASFRFHIA